MTTDEIAALLRRVDNNGRVETDQEQAAINRLAAIWDEPMRNKGVDCPRCHLRRILQASTEIAMSEEK